MTSGAGASSRPESPLRLRARAFLARDAWKEGRLFFEEAARHAPRDAEARAHLGFFCVKESRYDTARGLSEFDAALRLDPACVVAHLYRAITRGYRLEAGAAWKSVDDAARLGAAEDDLAWARGCVELDAGSVDEAIAQFRRFSELRKDSFSLILLAQAYSQAGRNEEALAAAKEAGRVEPDDFRSPLYAGVFLAYLRRFEESRAELGRAERMNDQSPLLHHSLAYIARQQGNKKEEEGRLRRALDVDPDYVTSRKSLGDVCAASGRVDEARKHYARALELFSDYEEARKALDGLGR